MAMNLIPNLKLFNHNLCLLFSLQENLKILSKQWHWNTLKDQRDHEKEHMTTAFTVEEQNYLNSYDKMPSVRNMDWQNFIRHKLKLFHLGMMTYARRWYARLSLDKYIWTNRISDEMAKSYTKNQPSLFALGSVGMSPSSPFGIWKGKRALGTRRLVEKKSKISAKYKITSV